MICVEVSEQIHAPREEVFAVSADLSNWTKAQSDIISVTLVGERYDELTFEVVDRVKNEKYTIVQRSHRPEKIVRDIRMRNVSGKATYALEPREDGTTLILTMSVSFDGYYKLLSPFIKGYMCKRLMNLLLGPLKRSPESGESRSQEGGMGSHFAVDGPFRD